MPDTKPRRRRIAVGRSRTAEAIARIEAERARGKERQIVLSTKAVSGFSRTRSTPKPPKQQTTGRSAAAKAAATPKKAETPATETPASSSGDAKTEGAK